MVEINEKMDPVKVRIMIAIFGSCLMALLIYVAYDAGLKAESLKPETLAENMEVLMFDRDYPQLLHDEYKLYEMKQYYVSYGSMSKYMLGQLMYEVCNTDLKKSVDLNPGGLAGPATSRSYSMDKVARSIVNMKLYPYPELADECRLACLHDALGQTVEVLNGTVS